MASLRRLIRNAVLPTSTLVTRTTKRAALHEFFRMVAPVETDHALVRLGGEGDGGYLLPDDLDDIRACFSPGVATTAGFELAMARRGVTCFLADASVEKPPVANPMFDFEKRFLGSATSGAFMTLDDWVQRKYAGSGDLLLQMDIEGFEYDVFFATPADLLRRFRIMVVEFHGLDGLLHESGLKLVKLTFEKLLRDFAIVHIHPNNCSAPVPYKGLAIPPIIEVTLLRRDRIGSSRPATRFPHPLDRKNVPNMRDVPLPACWYRP